MAIIKGIGFSTGDSHGDTDALDRSLRRIAESGADYAELALCTEDVIANGRVHWPRAKRVIDLCARHDLRYTVHGALCVNLMDDVHLDKHMAVTTAMLELCAAIGSTVLVHHAGFAPAGEAALIRRALEREQEALKRLAPTAEKHGVRICVENIFTERADRYVPGPAEIADTVAAVDHPNVCGTLDFSHAYIHTTFLGIPYLDTLCRFAPFVNHLHVHDSFGRPNTIPTHTLSERLAYGLGDLHLPLGWGDIPWTALLPRLPFRPGTVMTIELPARWWSEMDSCLATARRHVELIEHAAGAGETSAEKAA